MPSGTNVDSIKDLVSIIVPVYNVKVYLEICIRSIVNQSYPNIEIILVDDGSTDGSGELCDIWMRQDKRIQVIHQKNGGLSKARNRGLEAAKGEWILFIDSDDYISRNLVKKCYESIQQYGADLVFFDYKHVEETSEKEMPNKERVVVEEYLGNEMLEEFIRSDKGSSMVCNKMYSRMIWSILRFPVGKIHEDEYVIVDIWKQVKKAVYRKEVLYYYRQRQGSIVHSQNRKSNYDALEAFRLRCNKLKGNPDLYYFAFKDYMNRVISLYYMVSEKNAMKQLEKLFREDWNPKVKKYLSNREKVRFKLFYFCPKLCLHIMKWKLILKNKKIKEF